MLPGRMLCQFAVSISGLLFNHASHAQAATPASSPVLDMTRPTKNINDAQVIGGARVSGAAWPATFKFFDRLNRKCTATAVGDRAILTAAHCVDNGQAGVVRLNAIDKPVDLICDHHPDYASDLSADFALCITSRPLAMDPLRYEVISQRANLIKKDSSVIILGFGCLTSAGIDDNQFLYEGTASIYSINTLGWVVTVGAGVCFGDSGGAAYGMDTYRRIIGVNSRGNISTDSWLALTVAPRFLQWAQKWRSAEGVSICGIHPNAQNCHQ